MGKGSKRRPMQIKQKQWEENYDRVFKNKKKKEENTDDLVLMNTLISIELGMTNVF